MYARTHVLSPLFNNQPLNKKINLHRTTTTTIAFIAHSTRTRARAHTHARTHTRLLGESLRRLLLQLLRQLLLQQLLLQLPLLAAAVAV